MATNPSTYVMRPDLAGVSRAFCSTVGCKVADPMIEVVKETGEKQLICPKHAKNTSPNFSITKPQRLSSKSLKDLDNVPETLLVVPKENKVESEVETKPEAKSGITLVLSLEDLEKNPLEAILSKVVEALDEYPTPTLKVAKRLMKIQDNVNKLIK